MNRLQSNKTNSSPTTSPAAASSAALLAVAVSVLLAGCGGLAKEVSGVGVAMGQNQSLVRAAAQGSAAEALARQLNAEAITFAYQAMPGANVLTTRVEASVPVSAEFSDKDGWTVATAKGTRSDAALAAMKGLKYFEVSGEATRKGADLARLLAVAESRALRAAVAMAEPELAKEGRVTGTFTVGAQVVTWTEGGVKLDLKVAVTVKDKGALPPEQKADVLKASVFEAELLGETPRALDLRKQQVELLPSSGGLHDAYARALLLAGQNGTAADEFGKAAALLPARSDELIGNQIAALQTVDAPKAAALQKQLDDAKAARKAAFDAAKAALDAAKATAEAARNNAAAKLAELQETTKKPGTKAEIARATVASLQARIDQAKADSAVADAAVGAAPFEKDPAAALKAAAGAKASAEGSAADAAKALEEASKVLALEEKVEKIKKRGKPRN